MSSLEGKKAPTFKLEGSDGKTHALSDYAGKTVILYFYPKDNTPGCTKEACEFSNRHSTVSANNVVILGVSKDSIKSHTSFIEKFNLPFVLLSDPDKNVMKKYGAWGEKKMYGKIVEGTIRSTVIIGPDGNVLKHWKQVKNAEQHPEDVATFLETIK